MLPLRLLGLWFVCLLPCGAAQWNAAQKQWALAASGIPAQVNGSGFVRLAGPAKQFPPLAKAQLIQQEHVYSREELLTTIEELLVPKRGTFRIGWELPRAIYFARLGYDAGYLSQAEAWDFIIPAAQRLQLAYSSWQQLGDAYLKGSYVWTSRPMDRRNADWAYRQLLVDPSSPWRVILWNRDIGNALAIPPSVDQTAELVMQAHLDGLTCVRLRLPNASSAAMMLPAVRQMIGCEPKITNQRKDGQDAVLDAECVQPGAAHEGQIVTTFRMESLEAPLRDSGVTQLFVFVEHSPMGESSLTPGARDSWVFDGARQYADVRWLRDPLHTETLTYGVPPAWLRSFRTAAIVFVMLIFAAVLLVASQIKAQISLKTIRQIAFVKIAAWLAGPVLMISWHGLDIAIFWTGVEGASGEIGGLLRVLPVIFAFRWAVELILGFARARATNPPYSFSRIIRASFWFVVAEMPWLGVLVLLASRTFPWTLGMIVILVATAALLTYFISKIGARSLEARLVESGALYDAVFGIAARLGVPLKRLRVESDNPWVRFTPFERTSGELTLQTWLIRTLSYDELNAMIEQRLILIKNGYSTTMVWTTVLLIGVWTLFASAFQILPSGGFVLISLLSVAFLCWLVSLNIRNRLELRAERQVLQTPAVGDARISALGRLLAAVGQKISDQMILRYVSRSGYSLEKVVALTKPNRPSAPGYPIPV